MMTSGAVAVAALSIMIALLASSLSEPSTPTVYVQQHLPCLYSLYDEGAVPLTPPSKAPGKVV